MRTIYFNELFDTIIFFTNTKLRKEFNTDDYEKYKLDFEELTNINEKNNLKNIILETIEITVSQNLIILDNYLNKDYYIFYSFIS